MYVCGSSFTVAGIVKIWSIKAVANPMFDSSKKMLIAIQVFFSILFFHLSHIENLFKKIRIYKCLMNHAETEGESSFKKRV